MPSHALQAPVVFHVTLSGRWELFLYLPVELVQAREPSASASGWHLRLDPGTKLPAFWLFLLLTIEEHRSFVNYFSMLGAIKGNAKAR